MLRLRTSIMILFIVAHFAMAEKSVEANIKILAFGDSLTAGYKLDSAKSYPALLEKKLREGGFHVQIINAGVSGDTTDGALSRVDWSLKRGGPYQYVLLCMGANDGLRRMPISGMKKNLQSLVKKFKAHGARVVLIGVKMPSNLGEAYRNEFFNVYVDLAKKEKLEFVPFLLEGVALDPKLNMEDQIHPNSDGYAKVADNVLAVLRPLLAKKN